MVVIVTCNIVYDTFINITFYNMSLFVFNVFFDVAFNDTFVNILRH